MIILSPQSLKTKLHCDKKLFTKRSAVKCVFQNPFLVWPALSKFSNHLRQNYTAWEVSKYGVFSGP